MEIWDLYDEKRRIIGEHIRGTQLPDNAFHLVVHVWICNDQGQYLMTQRSADKPRYPLYWECVGGAVQKGETSLQGALREVEEEIGLRFRQEDVEYVFSQIRKTENGIRADISLPPRRQHSPFHGTERAHDRRHRRMHPRYFPASRRRMEGRG